jgi:hypothetical protein
MSGAQNGVCKNGDGLLQCIAMNKHIPHTQAAKWAGHPIATRFIHSSTTMRKQLKRKLTEAMSLGVFAILCASVAFWLGIRSAQHFICITVASSPAIYVH